MVISKVRFFELCVVGVLLSGSGLSCLAEDVAVPQASAPLPAVSAAVDAGAELLLKRMATAMQTTNYEGLLVHMRGAETRSMRVFHRYDSEHGEREHLISLDGKPFEVIQEAHRCTCVWPQARLVVRGNTPAFNGRLSTDRFAETASLAAFYTISRQSMARIGGIDCRMVKLVPKDDLRFGYRLCIHEPSAMLLNLEVFDAGQRLEMSQFASLRVNAADANDDVRLISSIDGFRVVDELQQDDSTATKNVVPSGWYATHLPPGYVLRSVELRSNPHNDKPMEHLMFSDGLGSVSVFIERSENVPATPHEAGIPAQDEAKPVATPATRRKPEGVMRRVTRDVNGYRMTAVGDAPEVAMRQMLDGIEQRTP
jgi:sigma-E factor negative regulatory protein RseB